MPITIQTINTEKPSAPPKFQKGDRVTPSAVLIARGHSQWVGEVVWVDTCLHDRSRYFFVVKVNVDGVDREGIFYTEDLELSESQQEE